jgi:hypothetical protein
MRVCPNGRLTRQTREIERENAALPARGMCASAARQAVPSPLMRAMAAEQLFTK